MSEQQSTDSSKSPRQGISLRSFLLIIGVIFLIFGIATAVMLHSEPKPQIMAPGPHYHYETSQEII